MGGIGAEQPLCACYKKNQEFHKVVEMKNTGLVVYCHNTRREDVIQGGLVGSAISTSQDVFILHNTKDVKITSADLIPALEKKDISCPRCRQLFEHAQELLQKVTSIDKKNVMGICDHCRLKAQFNKKTCSECEEIVKKFLSAKTEQNENTKRFIKIWLSKMKHLLKDTVTSDKPEPARTRAYSELQIDRLCQYSPRSTRELVVKQMFHSETHKSDTNLHKEITDEMLKKQYKLDKYVIFTEPVEPLETPLIVVPSAGEKVNMLRPGPLLDGSNATFVEPHLNGHWGKQDHISEYYDDSTIDVKEEMKKSHDLSLRNMMRPEKEAEDPYPVSRRSDKYEIPKVAPWERPEPESEMDVKIATKKHMTTPQSEYRELGPISQRPKKSISRISQKSLRESHVESITDAKEATKRKHDLNLKNMMRPEKETRDQQYTVEKLEHGKLKKGNVSDIPKKVLKREDRYLTDDEIKFQRSVSKFNHEVEKPGHKEIKTIKSKKPIQYEKSSKNILNKQFSYFFPKSKAKEAKKPKLVARSSQLITDTQEKLRQRDEEEKRRHEEKRKKKLEEDETKRYSREEKKRLTDEKRKTVDEQKKLPEEIQRKKHNEEELENKLMNKKERKRLDEDKRQEELTESKTKKGKEKRGLMPESEMKGKFDEETEKTKKDLKPIPDTDVEKEKKGIKSKTEPKDKIDNEAEKEKKEKLKTGTKDKIDKEAEKKQKEEKKQIENDTEKEKKGLKSKTEPKDKIDKETEKKEKEEKKQIDKDAEKDKKGLKSKTEPKDKIDNEAEKEKKELSKTGTKDKIYKEAETKQKEEEKHANKEEPQRKRDEKDRAKQVEQTQKETGFNKKQDSSKESSKKNLDSTKGKENLSNKLEDSAKNKQQSSKETKEGSKKVQDVYKEKEEFSSEKKVPSKEVKEAKPDSVKEKEGSSKGKEKPTSMSEAKSKANEEFKEDTSKGQGASKKEKEGMDELQLKKTQAELAKEKEEDLKKKKQNEGETHKARELADKKARDEGELILKTGSEAKAIPKPKGRSVEQKDKSDQSTEDTKGASKKEKEGMDELQLKKTQAELAKQKEEDLKQKKQNENEAHKAREIADKKARDEGELKLKTGSEAKAVPKPKGRSVGQKDKPDQSTEDTKSSSKKEKEGLDELQLKKTQAELAKQKEEDLKKKQQNENEAQKAREFADKKARDEGELKLKTGSEAKALPKPKGRSVEQKDKPDQSTEDTKGESKKEKDGMGELEFKKLQAELAKQKAEDLKKKKQNEIEAQKLRELADKKSKEEGGLKLKIGREAKAEPKLKVRSVEQKDKIEESTEDIKGASKREKEGMDELQLKKTQAELAKQKEEDLKKKKQNEGETQKARELADKKARDEGELKLKIGSEAKAVLKTKRGSVEQKDKPDQSTEDTKGASKKEKEHMGELEFKKLLVQLAKQKEEDIKKKKQNEIEAQKLRELADKKAKEEGELKLKIVRQAKAEPKPEPKQRLVEQKDKLEEPATKELNIRDIKMQKPSTDDLILKLVKIRQTATSDKIRRPCDFEPALILAHKGHQKSGLFSSSCDLCNNSELEIDVESYDNQKNFKSSIEEIIIGEKIFKFKPSTHEKTEEVVPMLFKSVFQEETATLPLKEIVNIIPEEVAPEKKPILPKKNTKGEQVDQEPTKGIIRYALSDRTFIDKGWTMLPTEKVVRKMNVYRMRPAHPEFDWFEHNKNKRLMTYDTGEKLAEFDDNGRGRWYYRSGRLALDYYDAEETNAQQRFVVYSSGEPDERGRTHPFTILATFDYLGNGIVFDHAGKIRLKYNQTEGVVLDRGIGPVSHWKWHTLNDPPVLQQVMIDTQMAHKDPAIIKLGSPADVKTRPDNEEMLAIEFDNFIKEKSKKLSQKFKPFQIKMKALKINEHFSLKVLDQATIYLIYRDGSTNLKLNIGMVLDHQEIVDTDTAEVGEVSNNLERFPARTDSLAGLQRSVAYAQRYERQRTERERRLRPAVEPCVSAEQLTAAASPPLRPPLRTMPAGSTSSTGYCKCRKPTNNLYYNTRLL